MFKKTKIFIILIVLMLVVGCILIFVNSNKEQKRQDFLSKLDGEVVFTRRNSEGVSDVWKINANGTNEVLLFHNDFGVPYAGASFPQWSDDYEKIYFRTMDKDREGRVFEMNINGEDIKIAENYADYRLSNTSQYTRESDIFHKQGDLHIEQNNQRFKIYDHKGYYNQDYAPGASEASWSPNKEYIIFNTGNGIEICNKVADCFLLTKGADPDWK